VEGGAGGAGGAAGVGGRAYWLCQAAGWGLYSLYVLTLAAQYERGWHLKSIVSVVGFLLVVCPLVSHALRAWIIRNRWLDMPAARMLPRAALAVLLIAPALGLATAVVNVEILRNGEWRNWFPQVTFGIASGYAMVFSIWLWIYFSVQDRRRRRALELHTLKLEVVAHDARLRMLESQLNPHFLFNALNSVRALVVEDPHRAQTMITRLAELLRYTLHTGGAVRGDVVTLDDEIRAAEDYLAIERVRFEERLSVEVDVDAVARRQRVPRMLVLTLVENAVKHGISRLTDGGRVRITAKVAGDRLQVRVANSGSLPGNAAATGVGLSNARERLQLIYGSAASLTLEPEGTSVVASVSTPLQPAMAEAAS
jgi:two-component system, LytTR family, sensor kinase